MARTTNSALFKDYRVRRPGGAESQSSMIGHTNFETKQAGKPSAGNPHAGFEVAGAENGLTIWLVRHSQRKRGAMDTRTSGAIGVSPRPDSEESLVMREEPRGGVVIRWIRAIPAPFRQTGKARVCQRSYGFPKIVWFPGT